MRVVLGFKAIPALVGARLAREGVMSVSIIVA
jgi:hypothetical protein